MSGDTVSRRYVVKRIIFELEPEPQPCTEEQEGQNVKAEPAPKPLSNTSKIKVRR